MGRRVFKWQLQFAMIVLCSSMAQAALVNEWRADDYTSGSWTDHISSVILTNSGSPSAVANAFNGHASVQLSGTNFFSSAPGAGTGGLSNFTTVAVVRLDQNASAVNSSFYWNSTVLFGHASNPGGGWPTWDICCGNDFGANANYVFFNVGSQTAAGANDHDNQARSGVTTNDVHVFIVQASAAARTINYYVDGLPVGSGTSIQSLIGRTASQPLLVGGSEGGGTFQGEYAALQIYNDATNDPVQLSKQLLTAYDSTYPKPVGLIHEWRGDDYTSGANWIDHIGGAVAVVSGSPVATPAAFNGHTSVNLGGYSGLFTLSGGVPTVGLMDFTLVAAVRLDGAYSTGAYYWQTTALFGNAEPGAGQPFYCMSVGGPGGTNIQFACGSQALNYESTPFFAQDASDNENQVGTGYPVTTTDLHILVIQANKAANSITEYIDGIPIYTASVPMIIGRGGYDTKIGDSNGGGTFAGEYADIQIYNTGSTNVAMLTQSLLTTYTGTAPIVLNAATSAYIDPPGNVTVSVIVPAAATTSGPATVTLTSDNPSVVNSTNVTLAQGTTATNIALSVKISGGANITATGGAGTTPSAPLAVVGFFPRTIVQAYRAASLTNQILGITDGTSIPQWLDDSNSVHAVAVTDPIFHANATLAGTPSVKFNKSLGQYLVINATNDPVYGQTNYSVVAVFKALDVGAGGYNTGDWFNDAGIADHQDPSLQSWGLEFDSTGHFEWGTGAQGNPNVETPATNYAVLDKFFHVVIGTYDYLNGVKTVTLDDQPSIIISSLVSPPPIQGDTRIGANLNGPYYLSGELAELDFYSGALNAAERASVVSQLQARYNLVWPDELGLSISPGPGADQVTLSWPTALSTAGFVLQTNTSLTGPWSNAGLTINSSAGTNRVTDTTGAGATFYRLQHP